jgi:hypothetical protein
MGLGNLFGSDAQNVSNAGFGEMLRATGVAGDSCGIVMDFTVDLENEPQLLSPSPFRERGHGGEVTMWRQAATDSQTDPQPPRVRTVRTRGLRSASGTPISRGLAAYAPIVARTTGGM